MAKRSPQSQMKWDQKNEPFLSLPLSDNTNIVAQYSFPGGYRDLCDPPITNTKPSQKQMQIRKFFYNRGFKFRGVLGQFLRNVVGWTNNWRMLNELLMVNLLQRNFIQASQNEQQSLSNLLDALSHISRRIQIISNFFFSQFLVFLLWNYQCSLKRFDL